MSGRAVVEAALVEAHRHQWALVLAATVRVARDLDLAEECVQEADEAAVGSWARDGVPARPAAWLTTAARRRAMDAVRREQVLRRRLPLLVDPAGPLEEAAEDTVVDALPRDEEEPGAVVGDERLRLVLLCCHPALAQEAQVALTLRLVCGVGTADVARAFLVTEATMAARLTRAKKKIAGSRIPFRVPPPSQLPDRLRPVLAVVHLLFTTGHTAPSGAELVRVDLVETALDLARMLRDLVPDEPEVGGLLALLLATDARRATRVSATGRLLPLEEQDRSRWDRAALGEAHDLIVAALSGGSRGRYVLQAAIALLHASAPTYQRTDWPQLLDLYDELLRVWPSPVVALNRAVPLAHVRGPAVALDEVEALEDAGHLTGYQYLPAVRADLLARLGRTSEAAEAYRRARALTRNAAERDALAERIASLG